jgi:protein SCO1
MWMEIAGGRLVQVVCAAALMAAGVNAHEIRPQSDPLQPELTARPKLATIKRAPPIVLHDAQGRNVRLKDLHGRVILVSFIYTTCTTACPLLTERMAQLRDRLRSTGEWGSLVNFLSITVDPDRDSAEHLRDYAELFGDGDEAWRFLRDEPERLRPVLAAYGEWIRPLADGELDHPARLFLIDGQGNVREIYALSFFDERQAFLDIHALIAERH